MSRILLTNDDGVDSPALVPFARSLQALGDVIVVVPDRERSWIGKAISRTEEVAIGHTERAGVRMTTCTGYPADAAQLGMHAISQPPPELVVSGINLGFNHGTAFLLSSGTVGAAIEGWIGGLPAVAFSTGVAGDGYAAWRRHALSARAGAAWEALAATCATILHDIRVSGLLDVADVVSVNLPFDATPATPRRVTRIARARYDRLFEPVDDGRYRHAFTAITSTDRLDGTDVEAAEDGAVSITPVRMPEAVDVPTALRNRVEQPGRSTSL